jgi:uncharacterized protein YaaR (DUF327 family)
MRIEEHSGSRQSLGRTTSESGNAVDCARFESVLASATTQTMNPGNFDEMLDQITRAGRALVTGRSVAELKAYREAVRKFLQESIRGSYQVKEERRWDRRGNHRKLLLVKEVNQRLEELTRMVMESQAPGIGILAKLDEIRGLLLDLLV